MTAILRITDKYPTIVNESFEDSVGAWASGGTNTLAISAAQAKFGDKSMLFTWVDNALIADLNVTLASVIPHTLSAWCFIPASFSGTVPRLTVANFTDVIHYAYYDTFTTAPIVNYDSGITGAWQFLALTFLPDAADLIGTLRITTGGALAAGDTLHFDGVRLEANPYATDFVRDADTTTIDLIAEEGKSGFMLSAVTPRSPTYKSGGSYAASPFAEGRKLVDTKFENVIETYTLSMKDSSQDALSDSSQELRQMLIRAAAYWTQNWQTQPIWIEAKASKETNSRYAVIHNGAIPEDNSHWGMPFLQQGGVAAMAGLDMTLERSPWRDKPPGWGNATLISAVEPYEIGYSDLEARPNESSADDCEQVSKVISADTIDLSTDPLTFGCSFDCGGPDENNDSVGIRFFGVPVNQADVLESATLYVTPAASSAAAVSVEVYGEDADDSAVFSTVGDFNGRVETTAEIVPWTPAAWTINVEISLDVTAIVQEIINRGGWSSGNSLSLLIKSYDGLGNVAVRTLYASENATRSNHPRLVIALA